MPGTWSGFRFARRCGSNRRRNTWTPTCSSSASPDGGPEYAARCHGIHLPPDPRVVHLAAHPGELPVGVQPDRRSDDPGGGVSVGCSQFADPVCLPRQNLAAIRATTTNSGRVLWRIHEIGVFDGPARFPPVPAPPIHIPGPKGSLTMETHHVLAGE